MSEPVCTTCGQPHPWSDGTTPKHPFNDGSLTSTEVFGKRLADGTYVNPTTPEALQSQVIEQAWPFDPVLRQALIDKGVLTVDDLKAAEQKIRAVTSAVMT